MKKYHKILWKYYIASTVVAQALLQNDYKNRRQTGQLPLSEFFQYAMQDIAWKTNGNEVPKDKQKNQVKFGTRWTPLLYFNTSWKTIKSLSKVGFSTDDLSDS